MLSVTQAREHILSKIRQIDTRFVQLMDAANRVLAETVFSDIDFPLFNNSSMDGFAVRASDTKGAERNQPVSLNVVADVPAGYLSDVPVRAGQAIRVMTGAPLPEGSDAVIPVEETDFNYRQPGMPLPEKVLIYKSVNSGEYVRPKGQDIRAGDQVVLAGLRLRPQDIGLLAMLGVDMVPVYRKPRVAIFSSGDELVPVDEPLNPGKIHDSNSIILSALIEKYGGKFINLGIARDEEAEVQSSLDRALAEGVDMIISTAGVSVGAFDYVRSVVETNGRLDFWRVNMRPGKPLTYGEYRGIQFVGLPGNPVSAFVGFEVFVRPAILKMSGARDYNRPFQKVILGEGVESDGRESYLRAVVSQKDDKVIAHLSGHQGSGNLLSLVQSNALILIPSGVKFLPAGSEIDAWVFEN